jgi:hypothetical protein
MRVSFIGNTLFNLDFLLLQRTVAPNGTVWHAFALSDEESHWHEDPICWEIFVAELPSTATTPTPLLFVCGTLLPSGTYVRTEREWAAALERLLPDGEGGTRMEEVD